MPLSAENLSLVRLAEFCAPAPRRVTARGGLARLPAHVDAGAVLAMLSAPTHVPEALSAWLSVIVSGSPCGSDEIAQQTYTLTIEPHGVCVQAATPAGARHGLATLAQLVRLASATQQLPCGVIEDWPAIARRGVMLDVSRDRVPTMRELLTLVDTLAACKCNHLQLYIEHTFAYSGHETAWQGWSPMTPDELRRLDAFAAARGVEVAANQNCFGHLAHWLRLPAYAHLAETTGDWMFDIWPRSGPFSLCPTEPASLAFVRDLIVQQARCVKGELFNINCDEVYDIAYGRSKLEVERRGRVAVFTEFLRHVAASVREAGKRPMFWADVILTHADKPEHVAELVSLRDFEMTALVWGYEPDTPFESHVRRVHEAGLEAWVCPGTSSWRAITGRTREREANIAAAIDAATAQRARGFLLCEWGDVGHWQQWPVALHAMTQGISAAWAGGLATDRTTHARHVWGREGAGIAAWLQEVGDVDAELREISGGLSRKGLTRLRNATTLFASLHNSADTLREVARDAGEQRTLALWGATLARLRDLGTRFPACSDQLIADELHHTLGLSIFACERALLALDASTAEVGHDGEPLTADSLTAWLDILEANHRRLWLTRSRSGGLENSCRHFATIKRLLTAE